MRTGKDQLINSINYIENKRDILLEHLDAIEAIMNEPEWKKSIERIRKGYQKREVLVVPSKKNRFELPNVIMTRNGEKIVLGENCEKSVNHDSKP